MITKPSPLERKAYHEAGHFVASYIRTPTSLRGRLTIQPNREAGTLGSTQSEHPSSQDEARHEVVIYFAGYAAERRFDRKANSAGSCDDDEKALEILEWLGEAASEDKYRTEADAFVTKHWVEIEALAAELVECETISDSSESELIIDVARGEATAEELATYRALKAQ